MMKRFAIKLDMSTKKRNRANVGGLKVSEFRNMVEFEIFDPETIPNSLFILAKILDPFVIFGSSHDEGQLNNFFEWVFHANALSKIAFIQRIKLSDTSKGSNSRISTNRDLIEMNKKLILSLLLKILEKKLSF